MEGDDVMGIRALGSRGSEGWKFGTKIFNGWCLWCYSFNKKPKDMSDYIHFAVKRSGERR